MELTSIQNQCGGRRGHVFAQNSVLAPGLTVSNTPGVGVLTPGKADQEEPWLNRLQWDLIYTF